MKDGLPIYVKRLNENGRVPTKAHASDAGWDLYASEFVTVDGEPTRVRTGIALAIPEGHYGQIQGRSGLALKGIMIAGARSSALEPQNHGHILSADEEMEVTLGGVIDSSYRGELIVILVALDCDVDFKPGDKVAQLVILPVPKTQMVDVQDGDLPPGERGTSGFGDSDKLDADRTHEGREDNPFFAGPDDEEFWDVENQRKAVQSDWRPSQAQLELFKGLTELTDEGLFKGEALVKFLVEPGGITRDGIRSDREFNIWRETYVPPSRRRVPTGPFDQQATQPAVQPDEGQKAGSVPVPSEEDKRKAMDAVEKAAHAHPGATITLADDMKSFTITRPFAEGGSHTEVKHMADLEDEDFDLDEEHTDQVGTVDLGTHTLSVSGVKFGPDGKQEVVSQEECQRIADGMADLARKEKLGQFGRGSFVTDRLPGLEAYQVTSQNSPEASQDAPGGTEGPSKVESPQVEVSAHTAHARDVEMADPHRFERKPSTWLGEALRHVRENFQVRKPPASTYMVPIVWGEVETSTPIQSIQATADLAREHSEPMDPSRVEAQRDHWKGEASRLCDELTRVRKELAEARGDLTSCQKHNAQQFGTFMVVLGDKANLMVEGNKLRRKVASLEAVVATQRKMFQDMKGERDKLDDQLARDRANPPGADSGRGKPNLQARQAMLLQRLMAEQAKLKGILAGLVEFIEDLDNRDLCVRPWALLRGGPDGYYESFKLACKALGREVSVGEPDEAYEWEGSQEKSPTLQVAHQRIKVLQHKVESLQAALQKANSELEVTQSKVKKDVVSQRIYAALRKEYLELGSVKLDLEDRLHRSKDEIERLKLRVSSYQNRTENSREDRRESEHIRSLMNDLLEVLKVIRPRYLEPFQYDVINACHDAIGKPSPFFGGSKAGSKPAGF